MIYLSKGEGGGADSDRGVLSGKVGTGMCGPDHERAFSASQVYIGLNIGCVFAKCVIFDEFVLVYL